MNRKVKRLVVGASVMLMAGGVLWARALASWRPQLVGIWPELRSHQSDFVDDAASGPWLEVKDGRLRNIESGREAPIATRSGFLWKQVQFSPDGRTYAIATSVPDAPYKGYEVAYNIEWHDTATGRTLKRFDTYLGKHEMAAMEVAEFRFSQDSSSLIVLADNGVEFLPLASGAKRGFHPIAEADGSSQLSHDGKWLYTAINYLNRPNKIYDVVRQRPFRALSMGRAFTYEAEFSPDGALLATCDSEGEGEDSGCWVADIGANRKLWDFDGQNLNFSPDNRFLLSDNQGTIELRAARTGVLQRRWELPFDTSDLAFARDGNAFYAATYEGQIWKIRTR